MLPRWVAKPDQFDPAIAFKARQDSVAARTNVRSLTLFFSRSLIILTALLIARRVNSLGVGRASRRVDCSGKEGSHDRPEGHQTTDHQRRCGSGRPRYVGRPIDSIRGPR